jgi:serine protease Do
MIQNLTRDLAASFQFEGDNGVLIGDVAPNGPAEKAGLQSGDIVVSLNDKAMLNASQLRNTVAAMRPGKTATLEVFRDGKLMTVDVEIGLLDEEAIVAATSDEASSDDLGMTVKTLTPDIAEQLELDGDEQGVVVTEVEAGGFAARAGLQPGTIIVSVNGKQTPNVTSFQEALKDNRPEDGIRLQVKVDGFTRYLFLRKR